LAKNRAKKGQRTPPLTAAQQAALDPMGPPLPPGHIPPFNVPTPGLRIQPPAAPAPAPVIHPNILSQSAQSIQQAQPPAPATAARPQFMPTGSVPPAMVRATQSMIEQAKRERWIAEQAPPAPPPISRYEDAGMLEVHGDPGTRPPYKLPFDYTPAPRPSWPTSPDPTSVRQQVGREADVINQRFAAGEAGARADVARRMPLPEPPEIVRKNRLMEQYGVDQAREFERSPRSLDVAMRHEEIMQERAANQARVDAALPGLQAELDAAPRRTAVQQRQSKLDWMWAREGPQETAKRIEAISQQDPALSPEQAVDMARHDMMSEARAAKRERVLATPRGARAEARKQGHMAAAQDRRADFAERARARRLGVSVEYMRDEARKDSMLKLAEAEMALKNRTLDVESATQIGIAELQSLSAAHASENQMFSSIMSMMGALGESGLTGEQIVAIGMSMLHALPDATMRQALIQRLGSLDLSSFGPAAVPTDEPIDTGKVQVQDVDPVTQEVINIQTGKHEYSPDDRAMVTNIFQTGLRDEYGNPGAISFFQDIPEPFWGGSNMRKPGTPFRMQVDNGIEWMDSVVNQLKAFLSNDQIEDAHALARDVHNATGQWKGDDDVVGSLGSWGRRLSHQRKIFRQTLLDISNGRYALVPGKSLNLYPMNFGPKGMAVPAPGKLRAIYPNVPWYQSGFRWTQDRDQWLTNGNYSNWDRSLAEFRDPIWAF
jgi:hypothetical protein